MAADYWTSTQYSNWQLKKETLAERASKTASDPLTAQFPLPEARLLNIYFQARE